MLKLCLHTGWWIHKVNWSVWLYVGRNSVQSQFLTGRCLVSLSWGSGYCWEADGWGDSGAWRDSTAWRDGFRAQLEQWIIGQWTRPPSSMMGLRNRESVEVTLLEKWEGCWRMSCLLFSPLWVQNQLCYHIYASPSDHREWDKLVISVMD